MKTTLELPDALIRQVKIRAVRDGRKLKDTVADLLRKGLTVAAQPSAEPKAAVIGKSKLTGLPLIRCQHPAPAGAELTPERVAEILIAQDAEWLHASS